MSSEPGQPNVSELQISLKLWIAILLTGGGAGLADAILMKVLLWTQHLSANAGC